MHQEKTIIPIGGGKGGIGKSLLSANLAIALATMGHKTVVVDLDLGGSNLHSFLGLHGEAPGIGTFIHTEKSKLGEYLTSTHWRNLSFIPGDCDVPFTGNIHYQTKLRLMRNLLAIPCRYLLLDLGAGCSHNTLDFFRMSDRGMVVTTPEVTAVRNMLAFLNNLVFRVIERSLRNKPHTHKALKSIIRRSGASQTTLSVEDILAEVGAIDPEAAAGIQAACLRYRPRLVLNMGRHPDDLIQIEGTFAATRKLLSLYTDPFGFVFDDPVVRESINHGTPLVEYDPDSVAARSIAHIAQRIVYVWDKTLDEPDQALLNHTRKFYEYIQKDNQRRIPHKLFSTPIRNLFPNLFS